jgi:hypothetical protein
MSTLKNKKRGSVMRLLILAAAATLALTGAASANDSIKHTKKARFQDAIASVPADTASAAPADIMSAHDAYMKNLRDSGYNPSGDRDASGNVKAN